MIRRILVAVLVVFALVGRPCPATADGGSQLATLVAAATGINRTYDSTLAAMAETRTAQADFTHHELTALTSVGWSYGEVIAWNRNAADPYAYAVDGWMGSPEHAAILLDPFYARIGCDHRAGVIHDGKTWDYFVCLVGSLPNDPPAPAFGGTIPDTALDRRCP